MKLRCGFNRPDPLISAENPSLCVLYQYFHALTHSLRSIRAEAADGRSTFDFRRRNSRPQTPARLLQKHTN